VQWLLPTWIHWQTEIADVQGENVEILLDLYEQFRAGKTRFLIAFRHPSANDPICLAYLLSHIAPKVARQRQMSFKAPLHTHFIYDRGIPLWAGSIMGWLYSQLGGTPILRGKVDRQGLRSARDLFVNGKFPLAASPEGATNGHSEIVSPLEPGLAQMSFWCVEDLLKAGRSEQVCIVPVDIQYRYITPPWQALEQLMGEMEADSGIAEKIKGGGRESAAEISGLSGSEAQLYQRLYQMGEYLLSVMEQFYSRFYHQSLPGLKAVEEATNPANEPAKIPLSHEEFAARLNALLDVALTVAEQYFNLSPKGSLIDRCRRLEQAGWDYIYREDIKQLEALSPLERGLADRVAEEADLRVWHMRLVESFVAVTGHYVLEKPTVERFAETSLLMWDVIARIKGGNPFDRPKLGKQRAQLKVGQPISVSDRWEAYHSNRRAAKQAVADLTQDLQAALEGMSTQA
jgi:hypothetical protein